MVKYVTTPSDFMDSSTNQMKKQMTNSVSSSEETKATSTSDSISNFTAGSSEEIKTNSTKDSFSLSKEGLSFVKKEMERYETKRSAILPCLYRVQKENGGWVPPEAVSYLSKVMDIPEAYINEVLSFYTMYNTHPVGKLHIQVCCNLSCAMNGGRELMKHLCHSFNVEEGRRSADGLVTVSRVECLGACDIAPMAQVNDQYVGPLKRETVVEDMKKLLKDENKKSN